MNPLLYYATAFALGCYAIASVMILVRLVGGPRAQDRIFALDLLYLHGMLVMLVLGIRHASDTYFECALLIALLSFVSSSAMAKFLLRGEVIE
jgi:multicomponent K+:H+ antiporter subunit F